MNMGEEEIIELAKENLKTIAKIEWKPGKLKWNIEKQLDGIIKLNFKNHYLIFNTEIRNEIRLHQMHNIIEYDHNNEDFLIIAKKIDNKAKEQLRALNIPYIEANGNIYLNKNDILLWVDNRKPLKIQKEKGNRAFTRTGLKVLFNFLTDAGLINQTQREIADRTGVALGNIPQIINGLLETGYLLKLNKNKFVWENRKGLLERWIIEYETILRPQLKKGKYTVKGNWQQIQLNPDETIWGGEPAADILTHHLRPEKFILYTKENQLNLLKNYRLMPDKNGELEVFEKFWKQETNENTAPPLLVYADLLTEGGKRNKETAEIIYNEYIQPNI